MIFINQVRVNPGVMYGNPEDSPGGRALKHACSVMVNMAPISGADSKVEDENENVIGHKVRAKIQKNKVGAPFRDAVYTIKYTEGFINQEEELLDLAVLCKVINRPNNRTYELDNDKFSGRQAMIDYLKDEACFGGVEDLCRQNYLSGEVSGSLDSDDESMAEDTETIFDIME
jgi:recombination protein RecA